MLFRSTLTKAESISMALHTLPTGAYAALALSHTAYDGQYPPVGSDHASVLRAEGFLEADVPDPLVLRAVREKYMDLPSSQNYQPVRHPGHDIAMQQVAQSLPLLEAVLHGITGTSVRDLST